MAGLEKILLLMLLACSACKVLCVPAFTGPTSRTVYLDENPTPGSYVMTAFASDPDGGSFTFSITPMTQFTIDANTGTVTVSDPLITPIDREASPQIVFTVNLDSGGSSVATLSVTVVLADVNDNSPVWINAPSAAISLSEDTPVGSLVYALVISDADLAENADIRFTKTSPGGTFSVHPISGVVTLASQLNHLVASSYTVMIVAEDQGVPSRSTDISFNVVVTDVIEPPPSFTQTHYSASIDEGPYTALTPANNIVSVTAVPSDAATGVVYSMVPRGDASDSLFSVSSSGAVNVVGNLDRETTSTYTLSVDAHAQDTSGNVRSGTSTATVIITVLDINDNTPVIENPPSAPLVIPENQPAGTLLYTLEVSDQDIGPNADVTFVLELPVAGPFSVGATNGAIHQTGTLDYETTSSYTLTIRAQDGGVPSRSATVSLTINIVDVLDSSPSFSETLYNAELMEGVYSTPQLVTTVLATTSLSGCEVRYAQQTRGDASDTLFSVDTVTGAVTLEGTLDREGTRTYTITITAIAVDPATPTVSKSRTAHTTVVLIVNDANDNAPTFFNDQFSGQVPESARIGDIAVAGVRAFDLDSGDNSVFTFALADTAVSVPFAVDANTGVVSVAGPLDYETTQSYSFMIVVRETLTTELLSSLARVDVEVINENDNQPSFMLGRYEFAIAENQAAQALVATSPAGLTMIQATDMDLGVFGQVTYSIEGFGASTLFAVNAMGQISTLAMLDYEERTEYHLTLVAEDGGGTLSNPFRVTTLIVIRVTDVNDNAPVFDPSMYSVILIENIAYPSFLTLRATDGDPPGTPNSQIIYTLTNSDGSDASANFAIDSNTGSISAQNLDHEIASTHSLRITATDMGATAMTGTAVLTVSVRDSNDQSPVFSPTVYSADLNEDHAVGSAVGITVTATDPEGHGITYFSDSSDADSAFFQVNQMSGVITLAHALNYDAPDNHRAFSFEVLAVDDAAPPRTGTATVVVNVAGINDNTPVISNPPATYSIVEGAGTVVPNTLVTITASDQDGDTIAYALNPTSSFFAINSNTGDITQVATLDRETAASHTLTVTACDSGGLCDNLNLFIIVMDYNDNAPSFVSLTESATLSECTVADHMPIATLVARDTTDVGDNTRVTYQAVSGDTSRFEVDSLTGEVRIAPGNTWDYETGQRMFTLTVRATDNPNGMPQLSSPSDAVVTVTLTDCNDHPPVFSQSNYALTIAERTTSPSANEGVFSGISVSDNDETPANTQQTFAVVGGVSNTNNWFDINPTSGEIFIRMGEVVNREDSSLQLNSMGQGVLLFDVIVTNSAPSATLTATATVTITIDDINDLSPMIDQMSPIMVDVVEHVRNQSILAVITATDGDIGDNAHISYSITSGSTNDVFVIDSETGILRVNGDLDQEDVSMYTLVIEAENDLAVGSMPDTITVSVAVIDSNDFSPVFAQGSYSAVITENDELTSTPGIAPGSTIATVSATDADGTETLAGQIEYAIASGHFLGNEQLFDIPLPNQGAVIVLRPDLINYETHRQFDVVIIAYDLVSPTNLRRQNSTHLVVNIVDVNDNPPVLSSTMFTGTVREEQSPGEEVLVTPSISGADADNLGDTEFITFSLVSGTPFSISSNGSIVTTTSRLDRETQDTYTITVTVQDSGGHMTTGTLVVTVTDVNDQPPMFTQSSSDLTVNIPENHPVFPDPASTVVQTVTAVDNDLGNNALITYLLRNNGGFFEIDSRSGEVRLVAPLDREGEIVYRLNVTATDGVLSSWIIVTVNIDPINDNNPVFTAPVFSGTIPEDAAVGTTVSGIRLNATDLDPSSNITYLGGAFGFNVTFNGYIVTSVLLDRETRDFYSFTAQATDGFFLALENALIEITVMDVNDEAPVFSDSVYESEVYELTPANVIILIVNADDDDIGINSEIRYSISSVDPPSSTGLFDIDATIGSISTTREVDIDSSDRVRNITLTITATDQGAFALTGTAEVFLRLVNRNLNAPQFSSPHYNVSITENQNFTRVGTVTATEPSGDPNTMISYSILMRNSGAENFWIDEATGEIFTVRPLNREERDVYTFTLAAMDNDIPPMIGFATVTVQVLDENDNAPYFDPEVYPIAISESTSVNSTVIRVSAYDDDIGSNAQLTYRIISGDSAVFAVSSTDGVITTRQGLDREQVTDYTLIIEAADSGASSLTATANVSILITDVNDNSPTFTAGAVLESTHIEIPEDAEPLTLLTVIEAQDPDFQLNGIVVHTFENLTSSKGPFQIERESGEVRLRSGPDGRLDRESVAFYDLTVVASDQRGFGPEVRSTAGTFRINVLDINDNVPTFVSPIYEETLREDFALNTVFMTVEGTDMDIGSNAVLYYHIIGESFANTTCAQQFCIDLETGEIFLTSTLDRETTDQHLFTIAVSNQPVLIFNETTSAPEDANTASVSVTVTDANDQAPSFIPETLFAAIAEEAPFGTTITTLGATDLDTGNGSIVWFEILTPMVPYLVDRDSGDVTTAGVFNGLSGARHEVTIRAFDNHGNPPTLTATATLIIQVFKTSEQVIITFNRPKEDIEAKLDRLHRALMDVTNARITITEVRVKQTAEGVVDITGTDLLFFALDPLNGNVVNPSIVIRIIDERYNMISAIFAECEIETIEPHPEPIDDAFVVPIWLWVVIGVLGAAVICMCCCFLLGCVVERRRSRRWKKKSSLEDYKSTNDQFASQMQDYQANPLWVGPYDNWSATSTDVSSGSTTERANPMYESQELTFQMFQDTASVGAQSSEGNLLDPIPKDTASQGDEMFESQEFVFDFDNRDDDSLSGPDLSDSREQLVKGRAHKSSTPYKKKKGVQPYEDDLLAQAVGDDYDEEEEENSKTSFI